jgi:hypothetical protein
MGVDNNRFKFNINLKRGGGIMTEEIVNPEEGLRCIREQLQQQWNQFQIVGRGLTPEEQRRSQALSRAIQLIDEALGVLSEERPVIEVPVLINPSDGAYLATNDQFSADLRVDITESSIISMDLFQVAGETRSYVASVRTNPGESLTPEQRRFGIIGQDSQGGQSTGRLELNPLSETQASVSLVFDQPLAGLPAHDTILLAARWRSDSFRILGLEVDQEIDVPNLPEYEFEGRTITIESSFKEAGLEVMHVGDRDQIPRPSRGWDIAELHGLMVRFADESLSRRAWNLNLLVLSEAYDPSTGGADPHLAGIMFDTGQLDVNNLPRQGSAVFTKPIERHFAGLERKLIQTSVHELGHALNLAHRFEREVGMADSTSFMNYDWRYRGGNQKWQFWQNFRFKFDPDEIRFLRHAPWPLIVPGGAEFHTVRYWSEGTGGYSPYRREVPTSLLMLQLMPPATGALFAFGQPVFLTVELTNHSDSSLNIPDFFLDPKSGFLELTIKRISTLGPADRDELRFRPIATRCYDLDLSTAEIVDPGQSMTNNINLTFGSAGFTFAEPGNYEVKAVLVIPNPDNRREEFIVRSNPLQIRIAYPTSLQDEQDALTIFSNKDVGFYFALGGSDVLTKAADTLEEIKQRRQGKKPTISDPLVAYITRCQAINLSREFITYQKGKFATRRAQISRAVSLLDQLAKTASKILDSASLEGFKALSASLKKR